MLTRRQIERIRRGGLTTHHDYWFTSLSAGEPFFEDGLVTYYDGRVVTLCGFPLRGEPTVEDEALCALAERWAVERGAESVLFIGPRPLDLCCLKGLGFRRVTEEHRPLISSELLIDCTGRASTSLCRRVYRRSRVSGFRARLRTGGVAPAEYMQLLELFYRLRQLSTYLADMAFAAPALLRSHRVRWIEAWRDGSLCGFVGLHKAFADVAVGLLLVHDHRTTGVSDFLYGEMLECARSWGASYVNVGPSPTVGHYNFKRKWGGEPAVAPYHLVEWARGHLARRHHTSWGPRLVRL